MGGSVNLQVTINHIIFHVYNSTITIVPWVASLAMDYGHYAIHHIHILLVFGPEEILKK